MKCDWNYVSKDRAKANIILVSLEVLRKLANENEPDKIVGSCMLMDALLATMEDDDETGDQ